MPTSNGYSVGDDVALVLTTALGPLTLKLTDFSADAVYDELESRPIGGPAIHDFIPKAWKGHFKLDRTNPNLDNYCAQIEAAYWSGGFTKPGYIYQTIREADGSVSAWRYTKVAFKLDKAGDFSGAKRVEQSLSFAGSRKIKVA